VKSCSCKRYVLSYKRLLPDRQCLKPNIYPSNLVVTISRFASKDKLCKKIREIHVTGPLVNVKYSQLVTLFLYFPGWTFGGREERGVFTTVQSPHLGTFCNTIPLSVTNLYQFIVHLLTFISSHKVTSSKESFKTTKIKMKKNSPMD
jgi:hypothetical protein